MEFIENSTRSNGASGTPDLESENAASSRCRVANGCQDFFVHIWGPYYGPSTLPTTTGCFSSSNPPTTWVSVQCVTAPTIPLGATAHRSTPTYPIGPFLLTTTQIIIVVIILAFLGYMFTTERSNRPKLLPTADQPRSDRKRFNITPLRTGNCSRVSISTMSLRPLTRSVHVEDAQHLITILLLSTILLIQNAQSVPLSSQSVMKAPNSTDSSAGTVYEYTNLQ